MVQIFRKYLFSPNSNKAAYLQNISCRIGEGVNSYNENPNANETYCPLETQFDMSTVDKATNESRIIVEGSCCFLNIYNDKLYFIKLQDGYIYETSLDTNETNCIFDKERTSGLYIVNGYLYFVSGQEHQLKKYKPGDNEATVIVNEKISTYAIIEDKIYYSIEFGDGSDGETYVTNLSGEGKNLFYDGALNHINFYDGRLYFIDRSNSSRLTTVDMNGKDKKVLSDGPAYYPIICDGRIVYTKQMAGSPPCLYIITLNGLNDSILLARTAYGTQVADNKIYFFLKDSKTMEEKLYSISQHGDNLKYIPYDENDTSKGSLFE